MKVKETLQFLLSISATLSLVGYLIFLLVWTVSEDSVSGVLRFFERYTVEENTEYAEDEGPSLSLGKSNQNTLSPPLERSRYLSGEFVSSAELARQLSWRDREITQLKKENSRLRSRMSEEETALREQLSVLGERLKAAQNEHTNTLSSLSSLSKDAASQRHMLEAQISSLTQNVGTLTSANGILQARNQKDRDTLTLVGEQYQLVKNELAQLKMQQNEIQGVRLDPLSTPDVQQAYAAGVMLGRDVQVMQQAQALLGLKSDNRALLAGLSDTLNNNVLLNDAALQRALTAADERTLNARAETIAQQKKVGEAYLSQYKQRKGVTQDPLGFWYHMDHPGDGEVITGDDSLVDVVVVEMLTDGTVVDDIEARGQLISQPLGEYPPLLRSALRLMKNHGSITLVVPSALAYGDDGYLPKVPPGATLVYTLRVESVETNGPSPATGNESQEPKEPREK